MSDNTSSSPQTELNPAAGLSADVEAAGTLSTAVAASQPILKSVRGQRYVAPAGRHSQQTHRRAAARAAAAGHGTQQEQHDHDRDSVKAEVSRLTALKAPQKANPPK